jgi:hypothetical protein
MRRLGAVMVVVAVVSFAAAAAGVDVRATYGARTTGDEPYYLITAVTLWGDRDLDISDEIEAGAFREWHEIPLDEQTKSLAGGRRVSPHDPLLPLLLALPVALGGWVGAKLFLAVLAGLLAALVVWIAVRRFGVSVGVAGLTAGVFGASAPFAVYGNQVYPELPAALCVAVAVAGLTGQTPKTGGFVALAAAITALPWLSIKYVPVAATLAVLGVVALWRAGRRRALGGFVAALALMGIAFVAGHQQWYGGVTPYAVGDHFISGEFSVIGNEPNYSGRARRLLGLLVDRNFGLVAWQPAWFLIVPAAAALIRARPAHWGALALPLAAGWLNATFIALTMQGWWWPGRQLVVVLPCAVVCIACWANGHRARLATIALTGSLGIAALVWLLADGLNRRITWVVDFYDTTNPLYGVWRHVLPDYLDVTSMTWVLHGAWLVLALAVAVRTWLTAASGLRRSFAAPRRARGSEPRPPRAGKASSPP